jgi:hypothetical protein
MPRFSATKTRPSAAKRSASGSVRPLKATLSWNPGDSRFEAVVKLRSSPQWTGSPDRCAQARKW